MSKELSEQEQEFKRIKEELTVFVPTMKKAGEVIQEENVSNYPIFVVHKKLLEFGIPLVLGDDNEHKWFINASTLEEFVAKGLVETDKSLNFIDVYKSHPDHLCLFILSDQGANFVFQKI